MPGAVMPADSRVAVIAAGQAGDDAVIEEGRHGRGNEAETGAKSRVRREIHLRRKIAGAGHGDGPGTDAGCCQRAPAAARTRRSRGDLRGRPRTDYSGNPVRNRRRGAARVYDASGGVGGDVDISNPLLVGVDAEVIWARPGNG